MDVGRPISTVTAKESVKSARDEGPLARRYDTVTCSPELRSPGYIPRRYKFFHHFYAPHLSRPRCSSLSLRSLGQHLNLRHRKVIRHLCKWHTLRFPLCDVLISSYSSGARVPLAKCVTRPFTLSLSNECSALPLMSQWGTT